MAELARKYKMSRQAIRMIIKRAKDGLSEV